MVSTESNQLAARILMNDSHNALYMLEAAVEDPTENWRVYWVAAVALLRAVGDVLRDIDSAEDAEIARLTAEAWPEWQQDPIFQKLDTSSDKTLNGYDFGVERHVSFVWSGACALPEENANAHPYGFLCFEGNAKDAVAALWEMWNWWAEKIARLEQATGRFDVKKPCKEPCEERCDHPCEASA